MEFDNNELKQLRPRTLTSYQSQSQTSYADNVVYIEREIQPEDTLLSFSIMYNCNVNELKKANNLTTEQDFFALRKIKIPVRRHGTLHEQNVTSQRNQIVTSQICDEEEPLIPETPEKIRKTKDGSVFLKSVDREIENVQINNQVLQEVVSTLGSTGYRPLRVPSNQSSRGNHSNWKCYLVVMLLFIALVVIIIAKDLIDFSKYFPGGDNKTNSKPGHLEAK